ncbi:MAG TPA: beta-glucosidase, partial [Bacteroidetes bacterium]|nr:beta-glucosidase [Bacteroidota bacterium]
VSNDGARLYIDGKLVVDNDGLHGAEERSGSTHLTAGRHRIRVAYFQAGGGMALDTYYSGPGLPRQRIPASALFVE